jgi:hypothetical protein
MARDVKDVTEAFKLTKIIVAGYLSKQTGIIAAWKMRQH